MCALISLSLSLITRNVRELFVAEKGIRKNLFHYVLHRKINRLVPDEKESGIIPILGRLFGSYFAKFSCFSFYSGYAKSVMNQSGGRGCRLELQQEKDSLSILISPDVPLCFTSLLPFSES